MTFALYLSNDRTTCSLENFDAQCKAVSWREVTKLTSAPDANKYLTVSVVSSTRCSGPIPHAKCKGVMPK